VLPAHAFHVGAARRDWTGDTVCAFVALPVGWRREYLLTSRGSWLHRVGGELVGWFGGGTGDAAFTSFTLCSFSFYSSPAALFCSSWRCHFFTARACLPSRLFYLLVLKALLPVSALRPYFSPFSGAVACAGIAITFLAWRKAETCRREPRHALPAKR